MQGLGIVPPLRGVRKMGPPIPGPEPWATGLQPLRGESLIEYPNEDGRLRL